MVEAEPDVKNLRSGERWLVMQPLVGSFGPVEVSVTDIAEQGAQLVHSQPLRIAMRGRLWFKRGDIGISVQGMIVWSRLSQSPSDEGTYLYHSGVRVEPEGDEFAEVMQALADHGLLRRDVASLERKRQRRDALKNERAARPTMKMLRMDNDIPADQSLLVQHARERLRHNPDEAQKWYNRAKFAVTEDSMIETIRHREDVLAVWEYLERTVPLSTIIRVFEKAH
jgi:hypothetical protein